MDKNMRNLCFDVLDACVKNGFMNHNVIERIKRAEEIKKKFHIYRRTMKAKDAKEKLANDYCLSFKSIEFILYPPKKTLNDNEEVS
jgi:hypothetical protein